MLKTKFCSELLLCHSLSNYFFPANFSDERMSEQFQLFWYVFLPASGTVVKIRNFFAQTGKKPENDLCYSQKSLPRKNFSTQIESSFVNRAKTFSSSSPKSFGSKSGNFESLWIFSQCNFYPELFLCTRGMKFTQPYRKFFFSKSERII